MARMRDTGRRAAATRTGGVRGAQDSNTAHEDAASQEKLAWRRQLVVVAWTWSKRSTISGGRAGAAIKEAGTGSAAGPEKAAGGAEWTAGGADTVTTVAGQGVAEGAAEEPSARSGAGSGSAEAEEPASRAFWKGTKAAFRR